MANYADGSPPSNTSSTAAPPCSTYDRLPIEPTIDHEVLKKSSLTQRYIHRAEIAFAVPENEPLAPRLKIATLFSMIAAVFPNTCLEEWTSTSRKHSITTGQDIPYDKEELSIYVPHERRNG